MTKQNLLVIAFLFVLAGIAFAAEPVTIQGEVIDLSCYLAEGAHGAEHATCGIACLKNGEPPAILEEKTGKIYLVVTTDHSSPATKVLPFVAKTVEVTGIT